MSKKSNENQTIPIRNRPVKDLCQNKYLDLLTNTYLHAADGSERSMCMLISWVESKMQNIWGTKG